MALERLSLDKGRSEWQWGASCSTRVAWNGNDPGGPLHWSAFLLDKGRSEWHWGACCSTWVAWNGSDPSGPWHCIAKHITPRVARDSIDPSGPWPWSAFHSTRVAWNGIVAPLARQGLLGMAVILAGHSIGSPFSRQGSLGMALGRLLLDKGCSEW